MALRVLTCLLCLIPRGCFVTWNLLLKTLGTFHLDPPKVYACIAQRAQNLPPDTEPSCMFGYFGQAFHSVQPMRYATSTSLHNDEDALLYELQSFSLELITLFSI